MDRTFLSKTLIGFGLVALTLLTACGSGGDSDAPPPGSAVQERLLILPSDTQQATEAWPTLSMRPTHGMTPTDSVSAQYTVPGRLVLWPDDPKRNGFGKFREYVDLASLRPRFEYVYVYDELFWTGAQDSIGWQEDEVLDAAAYARSRNLKPLVVILPYTVLNPEFKLKDVNAFDVIAIDIYPSMVVSEDTHGCRYDDNLYTNLLHCSLSKLRNLGFKGEVWYVYQGFGIKTQEQGQMLAALARQRDTLADAERLGVTGIVPFGLYLGSEELQKEPYLIPGKWSDFESLVQLQSW